MIMVSARRDNGKTVFRIEDKEVPRERLEAELSGFVRQTKHTTLLLDADPGRAARRHGLYRGQGEGRRDGARAAVGAAGGEETVGKATSRERAGSCATRSLATRGWLAGRSRVPCLDSFTPSHYNHKGFRVGHPSSLSSHPYFLGTFLLLPGNALLHRPTDGAPPARRPGDRGRMSTMGTVLRPN